MLSPEPEEPGPMRFELDPDPPAGSGLPDSTWPASRRRIQLQSHKMSPFPVSELHHIKLERNRTPLRDKARRRRPSALW